MDFTDTHDFSRDIERYAPQPHQSLTASLGREFEKYDQLCDAMESHLVRIVLICSSFYHPI